MKHNSKAETENESLDREMKAKIIAKEKEIESIRAARIKKEGDLAQLKTDYLDQLPKVEAEKREKIAKQMPKKEDLWAGRISHEEYLRDTIAPKELDKRAKAAAFEQLSGILTTIRKRADKIIELEIEELTLKQDIFFLKVFPAQNEIVQLKASIKALEAGISEVLSGQPAACARLDHLKTVKDGRQTFAQWSGLDESGVKAILFDPMLPSKYIEKLEEAILQISGSGKTYQITWAEKWKDVQLIEGLDKHR
jgi:hypothetical protein